LRCQILKIVLELVLVLELELELPKHFGSGTKVHSLAFGESASQLRLVHGFADEFEDD
jgi:hypothetical protein